MQTTHTSAETVMERCAILGGYSEEPDRLTRRYGSNPMRQVNDAVAGWMRAAGMRVSRDAIGNVIGRYEADRPDGRTLLLGSHLDTVRDAGAYDGPLGVMVALASIEQLHARGARLPFALEIYGFADEEGLRYHSGYLGSSVVAGTFDAATLRATDADGVALGDAIRGFGGDPVALPGARRASGDLLGYIEVHIEQGPVLEAKGLPVGVVSAIQGQSRCAVTFTGEAGHAGTVPMTLRHDALCAASEFALVVEGLARAQPGLVATIGQFAVGPDASNVIPGRVVLSLDVRHADDKVRSAACEQLHEGALAIGAARGVACDWQWRGETLSVRCDAHLSELLSRAVAATGGPILELASGAGHDAASLAVIVPIAMLFVRCARGISHNPAESVDVADVAIAIAVLDQLLVLLATEEGGNPA
ncbi:MAG TPA: allantoate amidohydrolase [Ktedonobacterales bacterium]|nr:allantoate amidohydrolase [Ktedonobacterales bacterium]